MVDQEKDRKGRKNQRGNEEKEMIVYHVFNVKNGKAYVGQTNISLEKRWKIHVKSSRSPKNMMPIARAIAKYGEVSFVVTKICECSSQEELDKAEDAFIIEFCTLVPHGYNVKRGGRGGSHSEETKQKISAGHLGKIISEETKKRMASSHRGLKVSLETRGKISFALKGRERSQEHRSNLSRSLKGKIFSENHRLNLSRAQRERYSRGK